MDSRMTGCLYFFQKIIKMFVTEHESRTSESGVSVRHKWSQNESNALNIASGSEGFGSLCEISRAMQSRQNVTRFLW